MAGVSGRRLRPRRRTMALVARVALAAVIVAVVTVLAAFAFAS